MRKRTTVGDRDAFVGDRTVKDINGITAMRKES